MKLLIDTVFVDVIVIGNRRLSGAFSIGTGPYNFVEEKLRSEAN